MSIQNKASGECMIQSKESPALGKMSNSCVMRGYYREQAKLGMPRWMWVEYFKLFLNNRTGYINFEKKVDLLVLSGTLVRCGKFLGRIEYKMSTKVD